MAAPADVTVEDLNGVWVMDKSLSSDPDNILTLQGIGWLVRKGIGYATVTITIKEFTEDGVVKINAAQTLTGGIKGTDEERTADWVMREHVDHIFGAVQGQSRFVRGAKVGEKVLPDLQIQSKTGDEAKDAAIAKYLRGEVGLDGKPSEGFLADPTKTEGEGEGIYLQTWVKSVDNGWTAEQVWGFETVNGERRYTRRVCAVKGNKYETARLIYTFKGRE